jgi:hypothetical protein
MTFSSTINRYVIWALFAALWVGGESLVMPSIADAAPNRHPLRHQVRRDAHHARHRARRDERHARRARHTARRDRNILRHRLR